MTLPDEGIWRLDLGATPVGEGAVRFRVWAPRANHVAVQVLDSGRRPVPMQPRESGYFEVTVEGVRAGARYLYVLDGAAARPDPASRSQPDGVHQASAVVDPEAFRWTDQAWRGLPFNDLIIYELHTGTFTETGTFDAIIPHLHSLRHEVGITAIELMPVAQFPGGRNWGYDGTYLYAPQSTYGGPDGLKALVDACHAEGLAVILDVVYNHLGPEGNYLAGFGAYFTDRYRTPWGDAINYDGPDSDAVRQFIVGNALYWVTEYHIDALRLDAIHGIYDFSAQHILQEIAAAVHAQAERLGRQVAVIAESDLNDTRVIDPPARGGYGLDGQWNDDFHHALRVTLTGEREGYYRDFHGIRDVAAAIRDGFVYCGQRSEFRRRRHGNSSRHCPPARFVVFAQNHDQVGNRAVGDRLDTKLQFEALKVARAVVLLSPGIPLLFMGEEYGETAPFQYFVEHGDPALVEAVRQGRRKEFEAFGWRPEDIPDPQDPATFERCRLNRDRVDARQEGLRRWTGALIRLRQTVPALGTADRRQHAVWVFEQEELLVVHRRAIRGEEALLILGFKKTPSTCMLMAPVGRWERRLDAGAPDFGGSGVETPPQQLVIEPQGSVVTFPAYTAAVYVASGPERPA